VTLSVSEVQELIQGRFLALDEFRMSASELLLRVQWGSIESPDRLTLTFKGLVAVHAYPSNPATEQEEWLDDVQIGSSVGLTDELRGSFDLGAWEPESGSQSLFWFRSPGAFALSVLSMGLEASRE
jgi:hypothetical protein